MKKMVKAASNEAIVKVVYMSSSGFDPTPVLKKIRVKGSDEKDALLTAIDDLVIPNIDLEDIEDATIDDIVLEIEYNNIVQPEADYIFLLELNGKKVIDNTDF